jgi:hypothetical protein
MLDQPRGEDILDAVARLLRDTLMPRLPPELVFQARVAANAVDLVAREMRLGAGAAAEARTRLVGLLGHDGALPDLEAELSARIRSGVLDLDAPGLADHLWATTLAKMAIDQPTYASYRRELESRAADAPATGPHAGHPSQQE